MKRVGVLRLGSKAFLASFIVAVGLAGPVGSAVASSSASDTTSTSAHTVHFDTSVADAAHGLVGGAASKRNPTSGSPSPKNVRPSLIETSGISCTFNGGDSVTSASPGMDVTVACTGFSPSDEVAFAEISPLSFDYGNSPQFDNEFDTTHEQFAFADGSGSLSTTFVLPSPFTAADPAATCPPTQEQVNSGLFDCLVTVVDQAGNGALTTADYTGQPTPGTPGYWEVASDGGIFAFNAPFYGSMGGRPLAQPVVGMAYDQLTGGYWEVASDGGIFAFNAPFYGSMGGRPLDKPVVGMAYDPYTGGYWEVASDGGIFAFNAPFYGSMGGRPLDKPIVGIAFDSWDGGYWEVASDGGIFAFGAPFYGSMGGQPLDKPVVGMGYDSPSAGYWEVASDGGIFAFNASFYGSMGGQPLADPVVAMDGDPYTDGYWEVASDGGIFAFNAPFLGSMGGRPLARPVVAIATNMIY